MMAITQKLRARINDLENALAEIERTPDMVRLAELEAGNNARQRAMDDMQETIESSQIQISQLEDYVADREAQLDLATKQLQLRTEAKREVELKLAAVTEYCALHEFDISEVYQEPVVADTGPAVPLTNALETGITGRVETPTPQE